MPKTILSHFDTKKRKRGEDEELQEGSVNPVDLGVSGIGGRDESEEDSLNDSYDEDRNNEYDDEEDEISMEDVETGGDDETESFGEFSNLIRSCSDSQLQLLLTGCLGRWTQRVPSKYINICMPYETPVDVLHNFGEGLFEVICKELFVKDSSLVPKSDLFKVPHNEYVRELSNTVLPTEFANISNRRNATDKILFFRLTLCLNAIVSDTLNTKARLVIVALSLLCNKMFTGGRASQIFDGELCSSASWFLMEASERYISCKAHEILYHLPHVNMLFNNVAPLSTFSFESAYQYILLGYSSKLTRNYSETVCSRVLLHNVLRRELAKRAEISHSEKLKKFCSLTPGIFKLSSALKYRVDSLKAEDIVPTIDINCDYFGWFSMSLGTLKSEYCDSKTQNDVFFVENSGRLECYRFVVAFVIDGFTKVLAEPIRSAEQRFLSLRSGVEELTGTDLHYGLAILKMMDSYEGITCGNLTGERSIIPASSIYSIGCYTYCKESIIALAINGVAVHN